MTRRDEKVRALQKRNAALQEAANAKTPLDHARAMQKVANAENRIAALREADGEAD